MSDEVSEKIQAIRAELIEGMMDFMQPEDDDESDFEPDYTQEEVDRVVSILDRFLESDAMKPASKEYAIMEAVKQVVLELNEIAEEFESLIETDQREQICEIIDLAATRAGLKSDEDITEEWREW